MKYVLGIESSCDETGIAIVEEGRKIHINDVASQIDIHARYGGVVPEIASRQHTEVISMMVEDALEKFPHEVDAVAFTNGPGLMGSLMVGANFAKAFAYARNIPFVPVQHIEGHIYSAFLGDTPPTFPCLILIVSGGHTMLVHAEKPHDYEMIGSTRDDAVGESFDKVARLLGLPYPGGPSIQKAAETGDSEAFRFPRAFAGKDTLEFSYSGLKTAVLYELQRSPDASIPDIAASFQAAAIDSVIERTKLAIEQTSAPVLIVAGGVAANKSLRDKLKSELSIPILLPPMDLCTDNAAMIAAVGYYKLLQNDKYPLTVTPNPNFEL